MRSLIDELITIIGVDAYNQWADTLSDEPVDYRKFYDTLTDKIAQEYELLLVIKGGQTRQDWFDLRNEDPHL